MDDNLPPQIPPSPPPTSYPETPNNSWGLFIAVALILVFVLGGLLFYLVPKLTRFQNRATQKGSATPTRTIATPTPTIITTKTKTFANDFIKFSYPETAKQSTSGRGYNFNLFSNNSSTGNFIFYSTSSLGTSTTIDSWITKNEKCGSSTSRTGSTFVTTLGITGTRIKNLGACPTGGSSVTDSFYFTTGKTVHILRFHRGGAVEPSSEEASAFVSLINSIVLATDTTGTK